MHNHNKTKNIDDHNLKLDLVILTLFLIIITSGITLFKKNFEINNLYKDGMAKQKEINEAWLKVEEALKRKEKLEEEAKQVEDRINALNKQKEEIHESYKRIARIKKDLDRIIGK